MAAINQVEETDTTQTAQSVDTTQTAQTVDTTQTAQTVDTTEVKDEIKDEIKDEPMDIPPVVVSWLIHRHGSISGVTASCCCKFTDS